MSTRKKQRCRLFPYKIIPVASIQEAKQIAGWGVKSLNLPYAWQQIGMGDGVKVALIDTGCQLDHPDLKDNIIVVKNANVLNPRKPPDDDAGHGSHLAGIVSAINNTIGMIGVAPRAKIMPIKVLNSQGIGTLDNIAQGIKIAVENKADVICLSLGTAAPLELIRKVIKYAESKQIPTFAAAGNAGRTKELFYPANYEETISVGSIDISFKRSKFSNTGKRLDFVAPGRGILSTIPNNWYGVLDGTSMSCPWLAGVTALIIAYVRRTKITVPLRTANDFRNLLKKFTLHIKNSEWAGQKFFEGYGIVDVKHLVEWLKIQTPIKLG